MAANVARFFDKLRITTKYIAHYSFLRPLSTTYCIKCSVNVHPVNDESFEDDSSITVTKFLKEPLINYSELASRIVDKSDAKIDPGSIYNYYPNAHRALAGNKRPERRTVWHEQDCSVAFPSSPKEANLDLVHYLEQRDMWLRRQVIDIPEFCVGSIIAVTRGDRFAPDGWTRFVGLCVNKNHQQNIKGANFILRNVIQGEPLEIQYPMYHPLLHKIEVLRHERWENEMPQVGLRFLRDYPIEFSIVDEKFEAEEYTVEPKVRKWTVKDEQKVKEWFEAIYESRRRR